jgi:hypothetical protein
MTQIQRVLGCLSIFSSFSGKVIFVSFKYRLLNEVGEHRFEDEADIKEPLADIFRMDRPVAYQGPPPP